MTVSLIARTLGRVTGAPPERLGVARLLIGGYTLHYLGKRREMLRKVSRTDPALFAPMGPVRALRQPTPPRVADLINDATLASSLLFALGVGHRVVGPAHSALLTWTLSYRNSWSKIYHNDNTLVLHTILLGVSPAADAVAWASRSPLTGLAGQPGPAHPRYSWPLHLMNATSTATYLLAGIAKVAGPSGWAWADGDQRRRHIAIDAVRKAVYGKPAGPAGHTLYRHRALFTGLAAGSLAVELLAPLALIDRRVGRLWAVSAFGMHWGIRAIMGIKFRYQQTGVSFAPWFDLERLLRAAGRR